MMVWVWPPQISISTHGWLVIWPISAAKASAMRWSRYSSRYFISRNPTRTPQQARRSKQKLQLRFQRSHLLQKLVCALGFDRVHTADGEANVDHHVVAQTCLRYKVKGDLAHDAPELHAGRAHLAQFLNFENFSWYRKAHGSSPHSQYIGVGWRNL